jgi:hypothetical protein
MTPGWRGASLIVAVLAALPRAAAAQPGSSTSGRFEASATAIWVTSAPLGGRAASLTPNVSQPPYALFSAAADLATSVGVDVRFGYRVSRALTLSLAGGASRAQVRVRISGDTEGAPDATFTGDTLEQWTVGGRADYEIRRWRFASGRGRPFVLAAAGLLRQLHTGRVSVETGQVYEGGAGLAWTAATRPASWLSRWSLVAELRVTHVRGGFSWDGGARTAPAFGGGVSTTWGRPRKRGIMGHAG